MGWQSKRQEKCAAYAPYKVRFCAGYAGYNRTVRHEWLDQYMFATIEEVQDYATRWLWTYNNDRPNMGLGGMTPAQKLKLQTAA